MTRAELGASIVIAAGIIGAYLIVQGVPGDGWLFFIAVVLISVSIAGLIAQREFLNGFVIGGLLLLLTLFAV